MFETVVRGVPLWLIREYVEEIGGCARTDEWLNGEGWSVRLTEGEDYEVGALRVGQVRLEIDGDVDAVARVWASLQPKLLRGGG
ncbi:MAG TPA: DUF1952 domain-containing protein [Anaerolineales bacterium]|nr:DUF1952 domain-containing protein [Anaerolineales bacterium]